MTLFSKWKLRQPSEDARNASSSASSGEKEARPATRRRLGILSDRYTDEVPGKVIVFQQ
jgi:hypothetical protein